MPLRPLTDKMVQAARAGNGRQDRHSRHEAAWAYPSGFVKRHQTWSILYRRKVDGRRRRSTLGLYPQITLAEARSGALDILARVSRGEDPAAQVKRPKDGRPVTFGPWRNSTSPIMLI